MPEEGNTGNIKEAPAAPGSLERKLFKYTIITWLFLLLAAFIPILGFIVSIFFFSIMLLWFYTGCLLLIVVFPTAFFLVKRKSTGILASLLSATRWSVIFLGVLGLMLCASVLLGGGYKPFTRGNWIHAKLWLNVGNVRSWAAAQPGSPDFDVTIPYDHWPSTLKFVSSGHGRLHVDSATKNMTLVEGGGFGHWGIIVTQKPQPSTGLFAYELKLEDGAWVWCENH